MSVWIVFSFNHKFSQLLLKISHAEHFSHPHSHPVGCNIGLCCVFAIAFIILVACYCAMFLHVVAAIQTKNLQWQNAEVNIDQLLFISFLILVVFGEVLGSKLPAQSCNTVSSLFFSLLLSSHFFFQHLFSLCPILELCGVILITGTD